MPNYISKRKILVIAVMMFLMTMSSVFLLVKEELKVENKDLQGFIIKDFNSNKPLDEQDYRKIINNFEDDFIIVNTDRTFRFITPNLEKVHGYTLEEMQSDNINVLTFIHPLDLPAFSNILMDFHKKLEIINNIGPIRLKTINEEYINYLITLIPFTNEKSERVGTGVILKNIEKPLGDTENKI